MRHWLGWSLDKFDAANISSAPYDVTMPRGPEAIEREVKFEGGDVRGRAVKCGSFVAQIFDRARINAADTCNVKHCKLIDLNTLLSSTLDHLHANNRDGAANNRSTLV
jgi:hypothetical protein